MIPTLRTEVDASRIRVAPGSSCAGNSCSSNSSSATPTATTLRSSAAGTPDASHGRSISVGADIWEQSFWGRQPAASGSSLADFTPPPSACTMDALASPRKAARNPRSSRFAVQRWLQDVQTETPAVAGFAVLQVSEQPLIKHGLAGAILNTATCAHPFMEHQVYQRSSLGKKAGTQRCLYDKRYYIRQLRDRCRHLKEEIHCLYEELEDIHNGNILASSLAKRQQMTKKRRDKLQGSLKDHVLVLDHIRCGTTWEELQVSFNQAKAKNQALTRHLDGIFLEKKEWEIEAHCAEKELEEVEFAAEIRMEYLCGHEQEEYKHLKDEDERLSRCLRQARHDWLMAAAQSQVLETRLHLEPLTRQFEQLNVSRQELVQRLAVLRAQANAASLSPAEQLEVLLNEVRRDNAEILEVDRHNKELRHTNDLLKNQLREIFASLESGVGQLNLDAVIEKDKAMTEFIESFDERKAIEEQRLKTLGEAVVQLLDSMSRSYCRPKTISAEAGLDRLRDDLGFKQKHLQRSEETYSRLSCELETREHELEQAQIIEQKLADNYSKHLAQTAEYEQEIRSKFDKIDLIQSHGKTLLLQLYTRKELLQQRADALREQVRLLKHQLEEKQRELANHQAAEDLAVQEDKIQQLMQTLFTFGAFVKCLHAESDSSQDKDSCIAMASDLNKMIRARLQPTERSDNSAWPVYG